MVLRYFVDLLPDSFKLSFKTRGHEAVPSHKIGRSILGMFMVKIGPVAYGIVSELRT